MFFRLLQTYVNCHHYSIDYKREREREYSYVKVNILTILTISINVIFRFNQFKIIKILNIKLSIYTIFLKYTTD